MSQSNASQKRVSREQETRQAEPTRKQEANETFDHLWGASANLRAPEPRSGYVQRWIRVSNYGQDDPNNLGKRMRQRWVPRALDSIPDASFIEANDRNRNESYQNALVVRGMVLMERPIAVAESQRKYNKEQLKAQMSRVKADLADSAAVQGGMRPYIDAKETKTAVESGAPMIPAED